MLYPFINPIHYWWFWLIIVIIFIINAFFMLYSEGIIFRLKKWLEKELSKDGK